MAKSKRDLTPIYLRAARMIDRLEISLCCPAICEAQYKQYYPRNYTVMLFARMFADDGLEFKAFRPEFGNPHYRKNQAHRVMALLWAAECWRDFV